MKIDPIESRDICLAFLSEFPFESFEEVSHGLKGYLQASDFDASKLEKVIEQIPNVSIDHAVEEIERENWNEQWEKNFEPIEVEGRCYVRAPFHPSKNWEYELVIMPKMSFGTGHHATTYLMLRYLLNEPISGKRVLDAGCGTSILAILAEKLYAKEVLAYDIDDWAVENSKENVVANNCKKIAVEKGTIHEIQDGLFNVILANINKNVLLEELEQYAQRLLPEGVLFLSGFYNTDIQDIESCCDQLELTCIKRETLNEWAALKFIKKRSLSRE